MNISELLHEPFLQLALLLALAWVISYIGLLLKQPLIVSFLVVGVLIGPLVFNFSNQSEVVTLLGNFGIALLLFVVGLKLDVSLLKRMGPVALATGLGQVVFTSLIGGALALLLGYSWMSSVYIAVALTFSSTIIIVKILSDKKEIESLHGKIAVGFLIVQDLVVILAMIVLSALGVSQNEGASSSLGWSLALVLARGFGLFLVAIFAMKYVFPWLLRSIARSPELLVLFAITWAVLLAVSAEMMGLSQEVGAFLAGFSLASSQFREFIGSRLVGLRDFFLLFFFVKMGALFNFADVQAQIFPAILFSLFVLIGNPLIVMVIMGLMGYRSRTSFLAGLTVAQISEFSLIFVAMGQSLGHLEQDAMALVTIVGLVTIACSTYMILNSHRLYEFLSPVLKYFEKEKIAKAELDTSEFHKADVIICGLGRLGYRMARLLKEQNISFIALDFDPKVIREAQKEGIPALYADLSDAELYSHLPLAAIKICICAAPDYELNKIFIKVLQEHKFRGKIILTSHNEKEAALLKRLEPYSVLLPFEVAAEASVQELIEGL